MGKYYTKNLIRGKDLMDFNISCTIEFRGDAKERANTSIVEKWQSKIQRNASAQKSILRRLNRRWAGAGERICNLLVEK